MPRLEGMRVGDEAHYDIVIVGAEDVLVCPYRMRVVEGPDVVDLAWWQWPIAIVLAPIGVPLLLLGAGH